MTVQLIAIDLDATLLRDDKTYDKARFQQVVTELLAKGVTICIATGNSYPKVEDYFDDLDKERLYFVTNNGNYRMYQREVLDVAAIEDEDYREVMHYLQQHAGYTPAVSTGMATYMPKTLSPKAEQYIRQYNPNIQQVADVVTLAAQHPIVQVAIMSEHTIQVNKQFASQVNERYSGVHCVTSGEAWLDIYTATGGKGAAIQWLQQRLGITADATMAFGDSLNDATMMQSVAYSMAMGNADQDLATLCRYQIGTNNEQAVIEVLEQLNQDAALTFIQKYQR